MVSPLRLAWSLDPDVSFLNHGSFGACPREVLAEQQLFRDRLEREPVRFFVRDYQELLDETRERLAAFLGAPSEELAFVTNATTGCNTVLRSLTLAAGDEIVVTDHGYNACRLAVDFVAERAGARVVVAKLPFPIAGPEVVEQALLAALTPRTRFVLIDHITSPTGLILPVERLVAALRQRGVFVMVDGAHAPGMLPLDLASLGADAYTGNAHKWLCAPKGAAFLHVRAEHHSWVRPLSISHGASAPSDQRSRFLQEFDWCGTADPSPWLSIPKSLEFMGALLPGGWTALRAQNRQRVLRGRQLLCDALGQEPPAPAEMIGSLAAIPLPPGPPRVGCGQWTIDPLAERLWQEQRIELPVSDWPSPQCRLLRLSAQVYNEAEEYERLAEMLPGMLADEAQLMARERPQ
ncbi:MAG: isopenicillin-N epimerase [Pseudohongiellaceae bacterium]|jgi:isopenicillin-N epimerase